MVYIHMLNADCVPKCAHGKPQDDYCRDCMADDMVAMRRDGKSVREIRRALGWSETTIRRLLSLRGA